MCQQSCDRQSLLLLPLASNADSVSPASDCVKRGHNDILSVLHITLLQSVGYINYIAQVFWRLSQCKVALPLARSSSIAVTHV